MMYFHQKKKRKKERKETKLTHIRRMNALGDSQGLISDQIRSVYPLWPVKAACLLSLSLSLSHNAHDEVWMDICTAVGVVYI